MHRLECLSNGCASIAVWGGSSGQLGCGGSSGQLDWAAAEGAIEAERLRVRMEEKSMMQQIVWRICFEHKMPVMKAGYELLQAIREPITGKAEFIEHSVGAELVLIAVREHKSGELWGHNEVKQLGEAHGVEVVRRMSGLESMTLQCIV